MKYHLVVLALISFSSAAAQRLPAPATFRADAQMVLIPVTVTDHKGKTITGLRAEDFTIFDEEMPQQIVALSSNDVPCSVGLILDISGSMRNILGSAKEVVLAFLKTVNSEDEVLLLTVSAHPEAVSDFTADLGELARRIELSKAGGMTALIDTVYLGLSRMRDAKNTRRALLILSDGMDNYSRYSKSELMRVAIEADLQIYTVIVDTGSSMAKKPIDQAQEHQGRYLLEELSDRTGGLHFLVRNDSDVRSAVMKIGRALRDAYVIGYHAPDSGATGKWHRVRVRVRLPKLNVYARSGYYAR